jgi:hypothetical protein
MFIQTHLRAAPWSAATTSKRFESMQQLLQYLDRAIRTVTETLLLSRVLSATPFQLTSLMTASISRVTNNTTNTKATYPH